MSFVNKVTKGSTEYDIQDARIQGIASTVEENNTNPVTSGGVYTALQNIPSGGGSVKEIDYSDASEWDAENDRPTQAVILDILENNYLFIHIFGVTIDEGVVAEIWLVSNTMLNVGQAATSNVRYYYRFDEGDSEEQTPPKIEQYMFYKPDNEDATMIVDDYRVGSDVRGTNDGTNWTTITIDNSTYSIPSGDEYYDFDEADMTNQTKLAEFYNLCPMTLRAHTAHDGLQMYRLQNDYRTENNQIIYSCLLFGSLVEMTLTENSGTYSIGVIRYALTPDNNN